MDSSEQLAANTAKNATTKSTRIVEPVPNTNSVEPSAATQPTSAKTTTTATNDVVRKSIRRLHEDVDNYYLHPNAGYVSRTITNMNNFKCQWQNYHGSIIAGSKAIVFQGSFFLFDKTFVLSWDNIRQVVLIDPTSGVSSTSGSTSGMNGRNSNNDNNSGIEIIMSDETVHSFMMNQQQQNFGSTATTTTKIWLSLLSLHNDALLGRQQTDNHITGNAKEFGDNGNPPTISTTPRNYERRNSDPAKSSILISPSFILEEDGDGDNDNNESSPPVVATTTVLSTITELIPIETIMVHAGSPLRLQPIHCTYISGTRNEPSTSDPSTPIVETSPTIETDGRLFIGSDAIIFIGTKKPQRRHYFASTWDHLIVTLPWMTILRIQQKIENGSNHTESDTNVAPNQIGLRFRTKADPIVGCAVVEEKVFDFGSIETPEQVWASLVAIHNEKLLQLASIVAVTPKSKPTVGVSILSGSKTTAGHPANREAISSSNRRKSHRRTNSDPMMASIQLNFDNYQELHDELNDENTGEVKLPLHSRNDTKIRATTAGTEMKVPPMAAPVTSYTDMWLAMKNQSATQVYSDVVIDQEVIANCTLDQFYDTFLNYTAAYSMERFLIGRGDFDVQTSDWEEDVNAAKVQGNVGDGWKQYKRVIKYMHPVNVPLAPPQAAARKEQILTRYNDVGICIVTQTFVDDVPMTDCFYVADRMLIEPSSAIMGAITIRMEFGITFVKSTMFKGIISRKTTAEFIELFKALSQYISNAVLDMNIVPTIQVVDGTEDLVNDEKFTSNVPKAQPSQDQNVMIKAAPKSFFSVDRVILLFIAFIQLWIVMELKGMKHAIVQLEQQQQQRNKNGFHMASGFTERQPLNISKEALRG